MQMPDLEVFRDIPGYRPILKAVLKTQIQALVEQLSKQTGEESVIVTASLEDGSLTHLGSDYGKVFLDSHDQFKSQFLGFCLKRNQMLLKTKAPPLNTIRKKGPVARGRRPRLAPYYNTNPSRKAPHKTLPQPSQYNQNYGQGPEPAYSVTDVKPGTSAEMKTVVKIEPGLENEEPNQIGEPADEDKVYIENMSRAFPESGYLGDEVTINTKDNHGGVTGTHSMIGAENQPEKKRGRGGGRGKLDLDSRQFKDLSEGVKLEYGGSDVKVENCIPTQETWSKRGRKIKVKMNSFKSDFYSGAAFEDLQEEDYRRTNAIRPFPCHQCPKRFKERHHLTYHLRIHSGQRPYSCDLCSKTFTQSSSLNTHKKLHLNEINCGVCGLSFWKKSAFSAHLCTSRSVIETSLENAATSSLDIRNAEDVTNVENEITDVVDIAPSETPHLMEEAPINETAVDEIFT